MNRKSLRINAFHAIMVAVLTGALASSAAAQTNLAGLVISDTGEPLSGVQLSIPQLQMGTLTNNAGRYVIQNVPEGSLIFRIELIGYESQQRRITIAGTTTTENFTLTQTALELEGLVVTALGITRDERALGYAVQDIAGAELTASGASGNLVNALAGKVSGVLIKNTGAIGGTADITIRGLASIAGNNQPLFVVDGVPISNAADRYGEGNAADGRYNDQDYGNAAQDINPDDVESISVLKGANAAALYGSRASNGVILITTKKGASADNRMEINASTEILMSTPLVTPDWQNIYGGGSHIENYEYVDGAGAGDGDFIDESWGPPMDGRPIFQWTPDPDNLSGIAVLPWMPSPYSNRDIFETGINWTNHISVAGSAGAMNGRLSATQLNADGQSPGHQIDRTQLSIAGGVAPTESLRVEGSMSYVKTKGQARPRRGGGGDIHSQFMWWQRQNDMSELFEAYELFEEQGSDFGPGHPGEGRPRNWNHNYWDNIYWSILGRSNKDIRDRFIGSVNIDYKVNDIIGAAVRVGTDWFEDRRSEWQPMFSRTSVFGAFGNATIFRQETNVDAVLTGAGDISEDFSVSISGGANRRQNDMNREAISTNRLIVPGIYTPANSAVPMTVDNFIEEKRVYSLYGMGSLTFRDYAFLDVTARNDWSSSLPEGNNSYFYPSVSTSLVVTDAFQWDAGGKIDYLKVRASWAEVGSDADPYQTSAVLSQLQTFQGLPGFAPSTKLPALNLKPEITESWEVGTDIRFADNRATLDLTYYSTVTRDQILNIPISTTSGFEERVLNAGSVKNKGYEVLLNTEIMRGTGLNWNVTLNWSKNISEVLELHESLDKIVLGDISGFSIEARVGDPFGVAYVKDYNRDAAGNVLVGDNGIAGGDSDLKLWGPTEPDWIAGLQNEFRFGGTMTFSFLIDVRKGGLMFCGTCRSAMRIGVLSDTDAGRENGISIDDHFNRSNPVEGVTGMNMIGVHADGTPNTTYVDAKEFWRQYRNAATPFIWDNTWGKLREMRLSFDLTPNVLEKLPFSSGRITVIGRNLVLWTKMPHIDPEGDGTRSIENHRSAERGQIPSDRTFGINFSVTR